MIHAGRRAKIKSVMTAHVLYRYTKPIMTSILTQVPFWFLFQKKDTGWHWKTVTKKKAMQVTTVVIIAPYMIHMCNLRTEATRRSRKPMESFERTMVEQYIK